MNKWVAGYADNSLVMCAEGSGAVAHEALYAEKSSVVRAEGSGTGSNATGSAEIDHSMIVLLGFQNPIFGHQHFVQRSEAGDLST
ncbi:hypothetical protein D3C85_1121000 [compost metagenome]|jgi:hypothetical protein